MSNREILEASVEVYAEVLKETGNIQRAEELAIIYFESLTGQLLETPEYVEKLDFTGAELDASNR